MKRIFVYFVFMVLLFSSCTESTQYSNDQKLQALKDNGQWEAYTSSAVAATTKITLVGIGDKESVTLKMELPDSFVAQTEESTYITYALAKKGINQAIYATQVGGKDYIYETKNGVGDGEIIITNYDGVTISGTFKFSAINKIVNADQQDAVNFDKGVFYKIPITFN